MQKLNVAVIGCGSISSTHINALLNCKYANLYAVCDIDDSKLEEAVKLYNCKGFSNYKELLSDENIHCVHICTPHYLHSSMAIDAMCKGKHVLTEKPMSISVDDAEAMIKTSVETGKTLGICFQNRYNFTSMTIKNVLESGKVGRIIGGKAFVTWHRDANYYNSGDWRGTWEKEGGGVLINQAIHTLDLLQWFIGDAEVLKASFDTRILNNVIEVEDTTEATIRFKDGVTALFYATNSYCIDSPIFIEIICEKAVIRLEDDLIIKYRDGEIERCTENSPSTGEKAYWGSSHKALIEDFYNSIVNNTAFKIDGCEAIKVIKLVNAIYTSHKENKYMKID